MQLNRIIRRMCGWCLLLVAIGCGSGNANGKEPSEKPGAETSDEGNDPASSGGDTTCAADGDCAPSECCHAKTCMISTSAPKDCGEMMCSAECVEGTMDCGKGSCVCVEGACQVKWRQ